MPAGCPAAAHSALEQMRANMIGNQSKSVRAVTPRLLSHTLLVGGKGGSGTS